MQIVPSLKFCSHFLVLAALLAAHQPATKPLATNAFSNGPRTKTEASGDFLGPAIDCDGDGLADDSRIDFDGDGVSDECVDGREELPEPPFMQLYTPTDDVFYSKLPEVGWQASYQCGDGLYDVSLRRPDADQLEYSSQGLTITNEIVYDDLDPNLNHPLIIKDPMDGIRYAFTQEQDGEFYEYAIADYNGNVGLYVYQTGEQIVAAPCVTADETGAGTVDTLSE